MKISLNWIKEYIPGLDYGSLQSLQDKMIATGLDIEGVVDESKMYEGFIVGEVIEKEKHPNADKLSLCKVNTGDKVLSIVCGAPNVDKGQKVCVATVGAIVPNGGFEIKRSKIRGELSEGMICSEKELNMSEEHDGILILPPDAIPGKSFAEQIGADDIIFEIGITPNRGDLFSHIGVAREIAALYGRKISIPEINIQETTAPTGDLIKISIENKALCRRFTGRVIKNVEIKQSPVWLRKRLTAVGLRPKNVIVDITNFVMFETGQPLHAFDYEKIHGKEIIVKTANEGDKFVTLDSKERTLTAESLMVCDAEGYSGIAGVMGGKDSEISDSTKNVFLESAYFDPVSVRKTSKRLQLQTDASQRFERGVDINMVEYASLRAAQLISDLAGGEVSKDLYDVYPEKFSEPEVFVRLQRANDLIGFEIDEDTLIKLLERIEIKFLKKDGDKLYFRIPQFRRLDITKEVDLIEEILRMYGYDNIKSDMRFNFTISSDKSQSIEPKLRFINDHLLGRGFNQVLTSSLDDFKKTGDESNKIVKLANSVSADLNSLRTSLTGGMLRTISENFNNSGKGISLRLFELGKVYSSDGDKFNEEIMLIMALSGMRDTGIIYGGGNEFDLFDIKGEAEMLLSKLNLENFALFYYYDENSKENKIEIRINDQPAGIIYRAGSSLKKQFEIDSDVFIAEFYLKKLLPSAGKQKYFKDISKFPAVRRDLAVVIDTGLTYDELRKIILRSGGEMLKNLEIFDMYEDDKLGPGKKSLGFTLEFLSNEKTLTDEEINRIIKKIIVNLEKDLGATVRS